MALPITFLDVFAERPLAGNGLAVVGEADRLTDAQLQAFAIETKLSETTFVQTATATGADYRNRIFDPGQELPFAGHPSLGTAVAVARWRQVDRAELVQQTMAGLQQIEVSQIERGEGGFERWRASMLQNEPEFGSESGPYVIEAALAAAGLEPADAHPDLPPQIVSTGLPHLMMPLASAEALGRVTPDPVAVAAVNDPLGVHVLYLFHHETGSETARARSLIGMQLVPEDPATGSAVGPLCAYLAERRGVRKITVTQGVEMGRPSVLEAEREEVGVRVSGTVVPVIDGELSLSASASRT